MRHSLFVGTAVFVLALDQLTKFIIKARFEIGESIEVWGDFFRLTFIYNPNAAFGISLGHQFPYPLVSIFVIGLLLYLYVTHGQQHLWSTLSLGMILGGALGNLADRIYMAKVVDFFDFEFPDIVIAPFQIGPLAFDGYYMTRWPIFNVADIAISVGVAILFVLIWFEEQPAAPLSDHETPLAASSKALPNASDPDTPFDSKK